MENTIDSQSVEKVNATNSSERELLTSNKIKPTVEEDCDARAISCFPYMIVDEFKESGEERYTSRDCFLASKYLDEESEGKEGPSCCGCNANNDAAGRTLNANNSASNSNANYAGGFAHNQWGEEHLSSRPPRLKTNEERIDTVGYAQADYESLPFMEDCDLERNANNTVGAIWSDLQKANSKRNLKNLRRFYESMEIAVYAVHRACKSRDTRSKQYYYDHAESIAMKMIEELRSGTYYVRGYIEVDLPKEHKTSKQRHAKIYSLYDRCIQNFCLTIIEQKLRKKVLRNNYSNIENRGIFCNDKRFCMANQIRHASVVYKDQWVLTTDIKKFYETVKFNTIIDVLFRTVKDKTSKMILYKTFEASQDLPIGCCLSPLIADVLMNDYDEIILRNFKPRFYAAFGDNRLYIGRKDILQNILSFTRKFYRNHYHFKMKDDYQLRKVSDGFTFCKTWYKNGFVRVRGELKRRAIRCALNPQSFAGYNGIFHKTDSKHLLKLIKNQLFMLRRKMYFYKNMANIEATSINGNNTVGSIKISPFKGDKVNFKDLVGKKAAITNFRKIDNRKDSEYYVQFQMVAKKADGQPWLINTNNGSFEIKAAYEQWMRDGTQVPITVTIKQDGISFYFEEYHVTNKQACDEIIKNLGIDLDTL